MLASYPPLTEDRSCEVVIIGGGITGALVAHFLMEAGVEVLLLDRREVGQGSTSASTALLLYEVDTPLHELMARHGPAAAVRAYEVCREALYKLEQVIAMLPDDCGFEWKQSLYLASEAADVPALEQEYRTRRANGFRLEWLERAEIEARFSFSYPAALLTAEAAQVDAYRLCHRLLARAATRGLNLYDRTEVVRYEHEGNQVILTTDRGCRVTARKVVLATGYETQQYLDLPQIALKSTYALASTPLSAFPGWHERCLIWESARPYVYLRTTADQRALIGGEDEDFTSADARDARMAEKIQRLQQRFRTMFPDIPLEVAYQWTGTFAESPDGLAYIGEHPAFPNGYFALGYGGNGITYSLIAAELLRDHYLGHSNPDARLFRFDRE